MEHNPEHIEAVLRSAPVPVPPGHLKAKLLAQAHENGATAGAAHSTQRGTLDRGSVSSSAGWRRWLLLLVPAGAAVALGATVWLQQQRLEDLRVALSAPPAAAADAETGASPAGLRALPDDRSEMERLRALVAVLEKEAAAVRELEQDNLRLKATIASGRKALPAEFQEVAKDRDRASAIQCVSNLKQLGVAVRIYASDNEDQFPADLHAIGAHLGSPKVLVCPADSGRTAAENWASFSLANVSYEFLSPGPGKHEFEPTRVLFRCPFHGHVGLCDGSVQMYVSRDRPEDLVSRNGALYMESTAGKSSKAPATATGGPGPAAPQVGMTDTLARRYGLVGGTPGQTPPGGQTLEKRSFEVFLEKDGQRVKVLRTVLLDANGNEIEVNDAGAFTPYTEPNPEIETVRGDGEDRP